MTIPIQVPNISPQVAQGSDLAQEFLKMLLQGAQFGQQAQQQQLERERLKLDKQRLKHTQDQAAAETQSNIDVGTFLQGLLGTPQQSAPEPDLRDPTGMAELPQPTAQAPSLGALVARTPVTALPRALQLATETRSLTQDLERSKRFEETLSRIPDPKVRQQFSDYFRVSQSGLQVPGSMLATLYPALFPGGIEPERMNSIWNFMRTTGGTFGQGRRALGVGPVDGISDDMISPLKMVRPTGNEQFASALAPQLERELPILLGTIEGSGGGISLPSALLASLRRSPLAFSAADIVTSLGDKEINAEQRQFLNAALRAANTVRFATSGRQSTNAEFLEFLVTRLPFQSDDEGTKQQKLAAFKGDVDMIRTLSGGNAQPSIVLERMLRIAELEGWNPKIIEGYRRQLQDAKAWEKSAQRRRAIFADDTPTDATTFDQNYNMWDERINGRRP